MQLQIFQEWRDADKVASLAEKEVLKIMLFAIENCKKQCDQDTRICPTYQEKLRVQKLREKANLLFSEAMKEITAYREELKVGTPTVGVHQFVVRGRTKYNLFTINKVSI